jgi:hypothetical protein
MPMNDEMVNALVNQVAKEIFVQVVAARPGLLKPEEAKKTARSIYELARAFAEVAKEQDANKERYQVFPLG